MSVHDDRAAALLKRATAQRRAGDLAGAIVTLRQAYGAIAEGEAGYTIDVYIRLPQFLHLARRTKEAWGEFNRLLFKGYPKQFASPEIVPMERSKLLDKMRLFLKREGQDALAGILGHLAAVSWCVGLFRQGRQDELDGSFDRATAQSLVDDLRNHHGGGCIKELCEVVAAEFAAYPGVDYERLGCKIETILRNRSGASS